MLSYDVVEWGKPLEKAERKTPEPKGTEVLLKLKYCGVCHSDVHIRDGYFDLGGGKRLTMSERGITLPATLGHEPYGTVVAAGPEAADVPIGEDRLVYPWTGCGDCPRCREGLDNFCMAARCVGCQPSPDGWDAIPGARGCTPQSCSFRDHFAELKQLGVAQLYGLSTQDSDYQREAVDRLHLPFPVLSDSALTLAQAIKLPTFTVASMTLHKRMALVIENGVITKVFYPVFPPDKNAEEVIAWLRTSR